MPELCDPCRVASGFGTGEPVVSRRSTTGYCLASLRLAGRWIQRRTRSLHWTPRARCVCIPGIRGTAPVSFVVLKLPPKDHELALVYRRTEARQPHSEIAKQTTLIASKSTSGAGEDNLLTSTLTGTFETS